MSYSWAEAITQYVTTVKASHITELRTNANAERASRGLGGYSWTNTITQYSSIVNQLDFAEIITALNQAEAENYCHTVATCPSYYSSYLYYTNTCTANLYSYYSSYRSYNDESSMCSPNCSTVNATQYANYNPAY